MASKIPKIKATCNMCFKQMDAIIELEKYSVPVCVNPKCPNFALLQISAEQVKKYNAK